MQSRMKVLITATVAAFLLLAGSAWAAPTYLALGDSLAKGHQPSTSGAIATDGYAQLVADAKGLELVNYGCSGATTVSFINGGSCALPTPYGSGSQLVAAEQYLRAHRGEVKLVTVTLGANDLLGCLSGSSVNYLCVAGAVLRIQTNMIAITQRLRQAAGPDVKLVGTTYYDPILAQYLNGVGGQTLALLSVPVVLTVNTTLIASYSLAGFKVADVASAFDTYRLFLETESTPQGQLPVAVARVCALTWACDPVLPDIHPRNNGYAVMAQTILGVS